MQLLKNKLNKAQATMKHYADLRHEPHPFKVGDWVLVKLRPYRRTSVAGKRVHKLSKRFYGPYKILEQIGEVAFKLELPSQSQIHPVFHASKLKPAHGNESSALELPPQTVGNQLQVQPLAVFDWKQVDNGN